MEFDIRVRRDNGDPLNIGFAPAGDTIRLVNSDFAYTVHDARISTSAGVEIEQNKYVGRISTILRLVTEKDGDLSTYFDISDENENEINHSSFKKVLIGNHTEANGGLFRGHLPVEYIFGFERWFKK